MDRFIERQQAGAIRRRAEAAAAESAADTHPLLRLQRQVGNSQIARLLAQREGEEDELQATHLQREGEDEELQATHLQRAGADDEEPIQANHELAQRAEEEEPVQAKRDLAQRAGPEEEELQAIHDVAQRAGEEEEEMQAMHLQRHGDDEAVQALHLQRAGEEEEELQALHLQREGEEEELQATHDLSQREPEVGLDGGPVSGQFAERLSGQRGGGAPLDGNTRTSMEGAFGTSFEDVRVHTGGEANALNRTITAKAFTTGSDIFLSDKASASDSQLMAHELTHVVQQRSMSGGGGMRVSPAGDTHEQEADAAAAVVTNGGSLAASQRKLAETE